MHVDAVMASVQPAQRCTCSWQAAAPRASHRPRVPLLTPEKLFSLLFACAKVRRWTALAPASVACRCVRSPSSA